MNQPIDFDTLFENLCSSLSFFKRINLNTKSRKTIFQEIRKQSGFKGFGTFAL